MPQELIYTSAQRGLKTGSRGFCTVASTAGMAQNIAELLERLSGYRHVNPAGSSGPNRNPVVHSFLRSRIGGRSYLIVSRIADAGMDYSQRSNKLAHHVAFAEQEKNSAGPAWLLGQPNLFQSSWASDPAKLPQRSFPDSQNEPRVCQSWQQITGDAGWGGALANSFVSGQNAFIIFTPEMDVLSLIAEAQSLLDPESRWNATFSTYFTQLPPNVECKWKCVLAGSPEAVAARRARNDLVIDLRNPGTAPPSEFTDAARTGAKIYKAPPPVPTMPSNYPGADPSFAAQDPMVRTEHYAAPGVRGQRLGPPPQTKSKINTTTKVLLGVIAALVLIIFVLGAAIALPAIAKMIRPQKPVEDTKVVVNDKKKENQSKPNPKQNEKEKKNIEDFGKAPKKEVKKEQPKPTPKKEVVKPPVQKRPLFALAKRPKRLFDWNLSTARSEEPIMQFISRSKELYSDQFEIKILTGEFYSKVFDVVLNDEQDGFLINHGPKTVSRLRPSVQCANLNIKNDKPGYSSLQLKWKEFNDENSADIALLLANSVFQIERTDIVAEPVYVPLWGENETIHFVDDFKEEGRNIEIKNHLRGARYSFDKESKDVTEKSVVLDSPQGPKKRKDPDPMLSELNRLIYPRVEISLSFQYEEPSDSSEVKCSLFADGWFDPPQMFTQNYHGICSQKAQEVQNRLNELKKDFDKNRPEIEKLNNRLKLIQNMAKSGLGRYQNHVNRCVAQVAEIPAYLVLNGKKKTNFERLKIKYETVWHINLLKQIEEQKKKQAEQNKKDGKGNNNQKGSKRGPMAPGGKVPKGKGGKPQKGKKKNRQRLDRFTVNP